MKRIRMLFVALALSATGAFAQNTAVYWGAFDQGFAAPKSSSTMVKSLAGQTFVGFTQAGTTQHEAGFLADTLLRGSASDTGVIVYSRAGTTRTIWMRASDGSFDTMVISGGSWPRLSHNGRYVLFHKGNGDPVRQGMFLYDLQTRRDTLLQANSDFLICYDWFDDDYRIVFDQVCGVYTINRDLTGFTTLYESSCYDDAPVTRPGSRAIAHHNSFAGIIVTDSLGVNRRTVPNTSAGDYWPSWSRDGQWIAFMRRLNDTTYNYYKIRPDGTGLTALTSFTTTRATFGSGGAWTPDGSKIIVAGVINGVQGIYAIATDGSRGIGLVQTSPGDAIDFVGTVTGNVNIQLTGVQEQRNQVPLHFELFQNYPNPFNPTTTIRYALPRSARVNLSIYNILGQHIATLIDETQEAGVKTVTFHADNLASGVYFYRLEAGNFVQTKKLVLLR
ncbi:MAG TPA: T9SS type A sorting domain-containing protein [Bacteroidota bacterium]|nr:T9SS type A sorting domain-containing protein [Bacteroidota bacterium]